MLAEGLLWVQATEHIPASRRAATVLAILKLVAELGGEQPRRLGVLAVETVLLPGRDRGRLCLFLLRRQRRVRMPDQAQVAALGDPNESAHER